MTRAMGCMVLALALAAGPAAAEFSLYGARFGMTRAELRKVWVPMQNGEYHVKEGAIYALRPEFDHQDRLFRLTFSAPLGDKYPPGLAAAAFQNLVAGRWGSEADLLVNVRSGKDSAETTVTHRKLQEEYTRAAEAAFAPLLRP